MKISQKDYFFLNNMKKVMVFGTFDGIHEGHRALFKQAKKFGDHLIAAVAQDHIVERLKCRLPQNDLPSRIDALRREKLVDEVVIGDAELSSYDVVLRHKPDVIALGYDQKELKKDLQDYLKDFRHKPRPKIVVLGSHKPEKYHSRLLNK